MLNTKIVANKFLIDQAPALGLTIALLSHDESFVIAHCLPVGHPFGGDVPPADLEMVKAGEGTSRVKALTVDGQAFLDLV